MMTRAMLTTLYLRYSSGLRAFSVCRVGCREPAAELTNETSFRALRGLAASRRAMHAHTAFPLKRLLRVAQA